MHPFHRCSGPSHLHPNVYDLGLRCAGLEFDGFGGRSGQLGGGGIPVDPGRVNGKPARTFLPDDPGAYFVTYVLPPIDDGDRVSPDCEFQRGVVARGPGSHDYHIIQLRRPLIGNHKLKGKSKARANYTMRRDRGQCQSRLSRQNLQAIDLEIFGDIRIPFSCL